MGQEKYGHEVMICVDSKKTVEIILGSSSHLSARWANKEHLIHQKPYELNREFHLSDIKHEVNFKDTGYTDQRDLNILFAHFPLTKYEMESIEMPLYASKVFPNAKIDSVYFDTRGRISSEDTHYLSRHHAGHSTSQREKSDFEDRYDLMITKSSTIRTMRRKMPQVLESCGYKVNIQTNNYAPNLDIGEDYRFCYTDFFAVPGRKFSDRARSLMKSPGFEKMNIVIMTGTVVWWKGQATWIENIDPDLLKGYTVFVFGGISSNQYFQKMITEAQRKNIDLLYSEYVNPDFLCDVLCLSKIKIMNHYADPKDGQPALGPSRTFGEAVASKNICVHGQTYMKENTLIGKTCNVPNEWKEFTIEYDQNKPSEYNRALDQAIKTDIGNLDFSSAITLEEKCDQIFKKCLHKAGLDGNSN